MPVPKHHQREFRLTLDTPEDYELIKRVCEAMGKKGKSYTYDLDDIIDFLDSDPNLSQINSNISSKNIRHEIETGRI